MSEAVAPWLTGEPVAPWLTEPEVNTAEGIAKSSASGAAKGGIGLLGLGGDLQGLMSKFDLSPWLEEKTKDTALGKFLKAETEKTINQGGVAKALATGNADMPGSYKLPTSKQIQGKVEEWTGPFYEPKTTAERIVHTGFEVLPGLALGGETLPGLVAKGVGAGVLGEGGERAGKAVEHLLPEAAQPYAAPVGKAAGTVAGVFTPAGARRAITPNPMSDEQLATVTALRGRDPNFPMTAGQATQSPRLMNLEARSPLGQNMTERQTEAFTGLAQREAGLPVGPYDVTGVDQVGAALGGIRRGNAINAQEFQNLNRLANQERMRLQRVVGPDHIGTVRDLVNEIRQGAANNPAGVLNMPGPRYEFMRNRIQGLIDGAANPQEKLALSRIREGLDNSFYNSVPQDVANQVRQLETQYANAKVLSNVPAKVGRETVTPQEVKGAVSSTWGRAASNENRGTLAPLAEDASRVMTPHPVIPDAPPAWFDLGATGVASLLSGGAGMLHSGLPGAAHGLEGGVLGHLIAPSVYKAGSRTAGALASNRAAQGYLGNQAWRPGAHTTADNDLILRALLTPPVNNLSE